jgi:hypothetical protein
MNGLDCGDAGEALGCISVLAAGHAVTLVPWLAKPAVIDLVAEAVETAAGQGTTAEHPWARGIAALQDRGRPAIALLLRARAEEGSGRSDQARKLIGSCLRLDPPRGTCCARTSGTCWASGWASRWTCTR